MENTREHITEQAAFAGGCFWCTEAIFLMLRGIRSAEPGYTGGRTAGPTYGEVSTGTTGHAEAVLVEYDPHEISFRELLVVFFATHDPTALNRQGNDTGTQYRSAIFYANNTQKEEAEAFIKALEAASPGGKKVVTTLEPFGVFYIAEEHHRKYYERNASQPYCSLVIAPKVIKVQKEFAKLLKKKGPAL